MTVKARDASQSLGRRIMKYRAYYLFILPALVYVLIFNYGPLYGIQIAFKDYKGALGIMGSRWVGLRHFKSFLTGHNFVTLMKNTFAISIYQLAVGFPIPIILALMLNEIRFPRYKKAVQTILYAPHFISMVVMVGIIITMFSPSIGVINTIRERLGLERVYYMAQPSAFRHLYVWSGVWQGMGWSAVIYISALSAVDPELHEAARIDGASDFRTFARIVLPLSAPIIVVMILYYGVGHWNEYFNAMIYLKSRSKFPLQSFLREILIKGEMYKEEIAKGMLDGEAIQDMLKQLDTINMIKYCIIIIATAPMLAVYPWLQKYFAKGVMIGSVKG